MKVLLEREKQSTHARFKSWCEQLDAVDPKAKLTLSNGFAVDMELQPHRWLSAGADIIRSGLVLSRVKNMDGTEGAPMQTILTYPVFLSGAELFLKGMLLCQYPECRRIAHVGYANYSKRRKYEGIVKKHGHNLLELVAANRAVEKYKTDEACMRFLSRIDALVRSFYYPLYAADQNHGWAIARYPKRFYKDAEQSGHADGIKSYPPHAFVVRLFEEMESYLNAKWRLRLALSERIKAKRARKATATDPAPSRPEVRTRSGM